MILQQTAEGLVDGRRLNILVGVRGIGWKVSVYEQILKRDMSSLDVENFERDDSTRFGARSVVLVATALTLLLFAPFLGVDPRLDELGSYWVVKDDLRAVFSRTLEIQGQSPLYYVVLWGTVQVLGVETWALRVPSLICTWLSSLIVFRLGELLGGRTVGFLSIFGFLLCSQIECVAIEARPYALAILCASISSLLFLHWLKTPRLSLGVLYALSAAATVYAHYLFCCVVCVHFVWFSLRFMGVERRKRLELVSGGVAVGGIFLLTMVPSWKQLRWLLSKGSVLAFAEAPTVPSVLKALFPPDLVLVLCIVSVFQFTIWRRRNSGLSFDSLRRLAPSVIVLTVVPPLTLLAACFASAHSLWVGRYFSAQCLGIGLAVGFVLKALPRFSRQMMILAVLLSIRLAMQYTLITKENSGEGWGEALQALKSNDPTHQCLLLNVSGYVESRLLGQGHSEAVQDFIRAPLVYHKIPNDSALIPYSLDGQNAQRYFQSAVLPRLERATCAWLLFWNVALHADRSFGELSAVWVKRNMPELGFMVSYEHRVGLVDVTRYERRPFHMSSATIN